MRATCTARHLVSTVHVVCPRFCAYLAVPTTSTILLSDLIALEEAKLKVARALVDLKLEHSKLQETIESDRYALTTDLLNSKNEVVELEMRCATIVSQ